MGIQNLAKTIKQAVQEKISTESRAKRGVIQGGQFISGSKSYPYVSAVDVNTSNGSKVWAQLDKNGKAVIIGG